MTRTIGSRHPSCCHCHQFVLFGLSFLLPVLESLSRGTKSPQTVSGSSSWKSREESALGSPENTRKHSDEANLSLFGPLRSGKIQPRRGLSSISEGGSQGKILKRFWRLGSGSVKQIFQGRELSGFGQIIFTWYFKIGGLWGVMVLKPILIRKFFVW